mgnify:CR=1 FL=1|tara:strand:+ start:164 stop:658 length:495 start_codon:yes stop_codon:yes gene_type:complete
MTSKYSLRFYERLRKAGVGDQDPGGLVPAIVFGFLGYFGCLAFYITMRIQAQNLGHGPLGALLTIDIVLHGVVGALVLVDALAFAGASYLLQTCIQGMGSFITFSLACFGGFYLYTNHATNNAELTELVTAFCALGAACVSNSLLLSLLFAYFHRAAEATALLD